MITLKYVSNMEFEICFVISFSVSTHTIFPVSRLSITNDMWNVLWNSESNELVVN